MVKTSGVTTAKSLAILEPFQLKYCFDNLLLRLHVPLQPPNEEIWTQLSWTTSFCGVGELRELGCHPAMVRCEALAANKNSLRLSVSHREVKMLSFVLVLRSWLESYSFASVLQNVKRFQRMLSSFHCFQQQLSVHSLKLRTFVLNVWLSVKMNYHKKIRCFPCWNHWWMD